MSRSEIMTPEQTGQTFSYDETTGLLRWIEDSDPHSRSKHSAGDIAGYRERVGWRADGSPVVYIRIRIGGRRVYAHRLIWALVTGKWPKKFVDHKNGDGTNNCWGNLREATHAENVMNRRATSGRGLPKGVTQRMNRFVATIGYGGKKFFLGSFDTAEKAHKKYEEAAIELHGEFARAA